MEFRTTLHQEKVSYEPEATPKGYNIPARGFKVEAGEGKYYFNMRVIMTRDTKNVDWYPSKATIERAIDDIVTRLRRFNIEYPQFGIYEVFAIKPYQEAAKLDCTLLQQYQLVA